MSHKLVFCDLPNELISKIYSFLDYKDLNNMRFVNKRLAALTKKQEFWKKYCAKYWLLTECPSGQTWEELFIANFKDMGAYVSCYAALKITWDKIKKFFKEYNPQAYKTITEGASEEELDTLERYLQCKLPTDYRCSFRLCSGQRLTSPGIMGSMASPGFYRTESLLDMHGVLSAIRSQSELKGCIPLTLCLHSGISQYMAVTDEEGFEPYTVFYPVFGSLAHQNLGAFISGNSFYDWLSTHADHLINNDYVLMQNQPFTFLHDPAAVETTGHITVSVATCFLPEISTINPPKFYHTYRITMTMSPLALESDECQLETRHWTITDETGSEETVDGPGVVGEYPIMYPGASFSWVSSTSFSTTYGNMKGYFRMRNLKTYERFEVNCPIFHMKCYPYISYEEREFNKARKLEMKKNS